MEDFDQPTIRAIARDAEAHGYRMSSFIIGVVNSAAFRTKRAEVAGRRAGQREGSRSTPLAGNGRPHIAGERLMQFLTGKTMPRRTFLQRNGRDSRTSIPRRDDAGVQPVRRWRRGGDRTRMIFIEQVHGAAGSNAFGSSKNLWAPAGVGKRLRTRRRQRAHARSSRGAST